jgi:hypothetical protein
LIKINNIELYVGTKEEYNTAKEKGMKIVCALNRAKGYISHQSAVGWEGKGCNKNNPYYLYKQEQDAIYLNMIDGNDPSYIKDEMINAALGFIHHHIETGNKVFIYCSKGQSRSPSIAFMYMLERNMIERNSKAPITFKGNYYPNYYPKKGIYTYIKKRYSI